MLTMPALLFLLRPCPRFQPPLLLGGYNYLGLDKELLPVTKEPCLASSQVGHGTAVRIGASHAKCADRCPFLSRFPFFLFLLAFVSAVGIFVPRLAEEKKVTTAVISAMKLQHILTHVLGLKLGFLLGGLLC